MLWAKHDTFWPFWHSMVSLKQLEAISAHSAPRLHCFPPFMFFAKFMGWTWQKAWGIFETWKIEGYPWFFEGFAANLNYAWKAFCFLTLWRDKFIFKKRQGLNKIDFAHELTHGFNSVHWSQWHKVVKARITHKFTHEKLWKDHILRHKVLNLFHKKPTKSALTPVS